MVDYEIDTTSSIKTLDAIAYQSYNQLVGEISQNHTISDYCKSRLTDFTCATTFQECPETSEDLKRKNPHTNNPRFQLHRANASKPLKIQENVGAAEPLQPCNSFCKEVLTLCGGYATDRCDIFPDTECFTIKPSSKKACSSNSDCGSGEYCFFYATGRGVCLVN